MELLELVKDKILSDTSSFNYLYKNIMKYSKVNSVSSRNNFPKLKEGAYIVNFDEWTSIETLWIALYVNNENVAYFDRFGVEYIPKEL